MDTFIQPKITGYRQLNEGETALINEGKALAEQCGQFIEKLREYEKQHAHEATVVLDQRWVSIGATQLQQGFMAVIRGIAKPTTF
jgi:predicted transcriptional regulator